MRRKAGIVAIVTPLIAVIAYTLFWSRDAGPVRAAEAHSGRVLVLGIDGMDPKLLAKFIEDGTMPNFARLAQEGDFKPLETSIPPQSPVAWSNMISGSDPGTHQIFDFIHRDPNPPMEGLAVLPFLSTSTVRPPESESAISFGQWRIPLSAGKTELLRQGPAFWDQLVAHGVDTTVYRMPANYPPAPVSGPAHFACLCGMGTPDLLGTYGMFTLFTPNAPLGGRDVSGGRMEHWPDNSDHVTGTIVGPANFLAKPDNSGNPPQMQIEFDVTRDPEADVAKIEIQDHLLLLKEGEWTDWIPLAFETGIPGSAVLSALSSPTSMPCAVRLFVKEVHPKLQLYVSPLNIDPDNAVNPISSPPEFARELSEATGRYYTAGIPQDTKALRERALSEEEFLVQCRLVLNERIAQYRQALNDFDQGCLFYYFGSVDQLSHIFWRDRDADHPGRVSEEAERFDQVIHDFYVEMDRLLAEAVEALDEDDTLLVISDHGFTSFRRGFNVNSWLVANGYMSLIDPHQQESGQMFDNVQWWRTRAYAIGLNALYINLRGREKEGSVNSGDDYDQLLAEISEKLLEVRDTDGSQVIATVYRVDELYPDADPNIAPDLLIGYAAGYRASWATALGGMPRELIEDNLDRWSGDHCTAHHVVPGVVLSNRKLSVDDPTLSDIAPTILQLFGLKPSAEMTGRSLFEISQ